jgi:hypothetical protein
MPKSLRPSGAARRGDLEMAEMRRFSASLCSIFCATTRRTSGWRAGVGAIVNGFYCL